MSEIQIFSNSEVNLFEEILTFLEEVYNCLGTYIQGSSSQESTMDVLTLNFVKVVNDCRAIILLMQSGFYIQASILVRSTEDACNFMMHIGFDGENAELTKKWIKLQRVTHRDFIKKINENFLPDSQLNISNYNLVRKRLDNFVHANYDALRLYPAQSPGSTPLDTKSLNEMTFWEPLILLFIYSCLLVVQFIVPDMENRAKLYLVQLEHLSKK